MKTIIHVNQHKLRANTKDGTSEPVLTVKDYKGGVSSTCSAVLWGEVLD